MHSVHYGVEILVDCGLFQGSRSLEMLNAGDFDFDPAKIDAVILTHAHIDHSGLLPKLVAQGFKGRIWCTRPTADLLEHMLADSGRIHEADIQQAIGQDWQNSYARFSTSLRQELAKKHSEKRRQEAIDEMRRVHDTYTHFKREQQDGSKR